MGAALCGMALAEVVSALPAQIRWADGLGTGAFDADTLTRLRQLAVSPTLLYGERVGLAAVAHEILWTAVFLGLLMSAACAVARRAADVPIRPAAFCLALLTFAPVANLLALLVLAFPELASEPVLRGAHFTEILRDTQDGSAHVIFLALAGACAGVAVSLRAPTKSDEGGEVSKGAEGSARHKGVREQLLDHLLELRGPERTLWRRIGATIMVTCGAGILLMTLSSGLPSAVLTLISDALCRDSGTLRSCSDELASLMTGPLPHNDDPRVTSAYFGYASIYALQSFALSFAALFFLVRAQPGMRSGPATTLLVGWSAYTVGAISYVALLELGLAFGQTPDLARSDLLELVSQLLVPPGALSHTLLAAPLTAGALALCSWTRVRLKEIRGHRTEAAEPADTQPAPAEDAPPLRDDGVETP